MRLIPKLLALLLAITSIAVPCGAKTKIEASISNETLSVAIDKNSCDGVCIKAIVARQDDLDKANKVQKVSVDFNAGKSQQNCVPTTKLSTLFKAPNAISSKSVNLYVLCRQLN